MSSDDSDDDRPLAKSNGHLLSAHTVSKAEDKALDANDENGQQRLVAPVSVRHGPVPILTGGRMDIVATGHTNGNGTSKRKAHSSRLTSYKDEPDSDDGPMVKRQKKKPHHVSDESDDDAPLTQKARLPIKASDTDILHNTNSDDDQPLNVKLAQKKKSIELAAAREAKAAKTTASKKRSMVKNDDSDDDAPLAGSTKPKVQSNGTSRKTNGGKKVVESSDSDAPLHKAKPKLKPKATASSSASIALKDKTKVKVKAEPPTPAKKSAAKKVTKEESADSDEAEEEEYKWWEMQRDDSVKWKTLEHNGVLFPPPYEVLPKNVKLLYDGIPVDLHPEAEEVATFFGSMLHSTLNVENPVFQKNFFGDFQAYLEKTGGAKDRHGAKVDIKEFSKLDFKPIFEYYHAKSEAKKARPAAEKKAEKAEKDLVEAPYAYCKWDGRKEKVGNFRVEPPGLFRGRGVHPKTGKVKLRVLPEQVTINIGSDAKVPEAPKGHRWKAVQHDNKATWLAMWQENVNGNYKYVMLAANSAVKGQSDFKKFEKARNLKEHIEKIRMDYTKDLRAEGMADRQRATAVYLIDKLALRAGNEKDTENEAETVGCCSLKFEHITLKEPDTVIFDFLGKDSIRYYDEVQVERQVFKNLKLFKKPPKGEGDDIFDRLNTSQLNKHLSGYMSGLTAKVFRTYNASYTMSKLLKEIIKDKDAKSKTDQQKIALYNKANREVAVLCNHKRTVGAGHQATMEKLADKIKGMRYQRWRLRMSILDIDIKQKKKRGADFFALDEDIDEQWVQDHINLLVEEQRTKIIRKFEKDNEKLVAEKEKPMPEKELKERLLVADDLGKRLKKEYKTNKVEAEGKVPSVDKIQASLAKIEERILNAQAQAEDREGNKEVALGTSKINYIDPRLTVVFAKKFDIPIEKFFSKSLRDKFNWAIKSVEDDADWEF